MECSRCPAKDQCQEKNELVEGEECCFGYFEHHVSNEVCRRCEVTDLCRLWKAPTTKGRLLVVKED